MWLSWPYTQCTCYTCNTCRKKSNSMQHYLKGGSYIHCIWANRYINSTTDFKCMCIWLICRPFSPIPKVLVCCSINVYEVQSYLMCCMVQDLSEEPATIDDWTVCSKCETFRPPRAHHCRWASVCQCVCRSIVIS